MAERIGSVVAFLPLAVIGATSEDPPSLRAAYLGMTWIVRWVIVPLALGSLLTGLLSALGTKWGLFRHYWVLVKLVLTCITLAVLWVQLEPIPALADLASDRTSSVVGLAEAPRPLVHATGGLLVLLLIQVLGVYKPRGFTRYGWRTQHQAGRSETQP